LAMPPSASLHNSNLQRSSRYRTSLRSLGSTPVKTYAATGVSVSQSSPSLTLINPVERVRFVHLLICPFLLVLSPALVPNSTRHLLALLLLTPVASTVAVATSASKGLRLYFHLSCTSTSFSLLDLLGPLLLSTVIPCLPYTILS
ncbi:hypothetical protein A2U01_0038960, partial [Trifolium medium]|nr:hypothetical protein [Trifolium medium]